MIQVTNNLFLKSNNIGINQKPNQKWDSMKNSNYKIEKNLQEFLYSVYLNYFFQKCDRNTISGDQKL